MEPAAEDGFYEEAEEVNCYDFEPLPTLLEDEVSVAGAGTEPVRQSLRASEVRRPRAPVAPAPACAAARRAAPAEPGGSPARRQRPGRGDTAVLLWREPGAPSPRYLSSQVGLGPSLPPAPYNSKVMVLEDGASRFWLLVWLCTNSSYEVCFFVVIDQG